MIGQGRPSTSLALFASNAQAAAACWGWRSALLAAVLLCAGAALAAEQTMRVRIAWGGGSERAWQGTVTLSQGTFSELVPLGVEADECGSFWLETDRGEGGHRLVIQQRAPRSYDGIDVLLSAPLESRLTAELVAADDASHPAKISFPLANLVSAMQNKELDSQGNRLLVCRAPGDVLRVKFERNSLIFSPGEVFKFALQPHLLPVADGTRLRIKVQLFPARSQRELWSTQQTVQVGQTAPLAVEVPLGLEEGAYDVAITAAHASPWPQAVRQPLGRNRAVAERNLQVLVLQPNRPAAAGKAEPELVQAVPIDPVNPRWWELVGKLPHVPKIPRLWKAPLGNGNTQIWRHALGDAVRLNPSSESPDVSWEAYTLPISQPGRPYVLEVEYPSDVPQSLGISILEPNAAGALMPSGLDSGIDLAAEIVGDRTPRWLRHRLIFWPRTTNPLLLLTNHRDHAPAVYGKIRVLGGWNHLPQAVALQAGADQRVLAAYFDRPLFPKNFSASEALDAWSGHSLDDWTTFHEGGTRLVEYLQHVGYNALMLSVLADGSTIYPSTAVESTPRYDKGVLFATGQDAVRKDVLEMLFRLCDREPLQLIPALEFSTPLPALEAVVRRGGPEGEAIQWIGPEGTALPQGTPPRRGLAPYYNVLCPQVQEAMLVVVREVVTRYGGHKSFGGLAIQLSAQGYAQLPGPQWGLDDATISRFQHDTQLKLPGSGSGRFAQRADLLLGEHRNAWLQWRAEQLSRFYRQLRDEVTSAGGEARLYLAGANVFANEELEYQLRPALTRRTTLAESLLQVGIDPQHYQGQREPVLLRPERIASAGAPGAWGVNLEMNQMPDVDRCFQGLAVPGSLFFHRPQEVRIESFDQKSPFKPTYTYLVSQLAPADHQNRRRFVHSLATLDAQVMVDGGWLLPLGEEESIRSLVAAYRRLPAARLEAMGDSRQPAPWQPVSVRSGTHGGHTYLYAVNDAPFRSTARIRLDVPGGCRLEELSGTRQVGPLTKEADGTYWTAELEPYDLMAVRFSQPGVQPKTLRVSFPPAVETALGQRIRQLGDRTAALATPPPLKVLENSGFERSSVGEERIPNWAVTTRPGVTIQMDKTQAHNGSQSAKMASTGPVACLVSRPPFAAPATGRLSISAWLRVADAARQPPLRLALEGRLHGQPYYRYGEVGSAPGAERIAAEWDHPYVLPFDDLPLEGLSQLRVRFDLMGPGEVWIDDVQLFDLSFSENERRELAKLITVAEFQLQNRQVGDCLRLLEGYWPRFLEGNVPLPQASRPVAQKPAAPPPSDGKSPQEAPQRTGLMDRVKTLLPDRLRF